MKEKQTKRDKVRISITIDKKMLKKFKQITNDSDISETIMKFIKREVKKYSNKVASSNCNNNDVSLIDDMPSVG